MTKKRSMTVLLVVLAAAVVLTGGLMASNMGFKLNRELLAGTDQDSKSGTHLLGLPYNRQVGIDTAQELFVDIGTTRVTEIQAWDTLADAPVPYSFGTTDYPLAEGAGYFVKMSTTTPYIIVGSHNPSATIQLEAGGGGASKSGTQIFAPPYHSTAATAQDLFIEIGTTNVTEIQKWDTFADAPVPYSFGTADFDLVPGEAYFVKMSSTLSYSPSHY